jgi:hypothetical protein
VAGRREPVQAGRTQDLREGRRVRPVGQHRVRRLQLPVEAQDVFKVTGPGLAEESHGRRLARPATTRGG